MLKFRRLHLFKSKQPTRGQSFLELALVLPVLLLMVMGLIEVAFVISRYLDALDLTREAARFASIRDPFSGLAGDQDCSTKDLFDFYWDTSCIFAPPDAVDCPAKVEVGAGIYRFWCNGLNKYLNFNPATDDVVISAYTIVSIRDPNTGASLGNTVSQSHPVSSDEWAPDAVAVGGRSYYWALSNHLNSGTYTKVDRFKQDCSTGVVDDAKTPYYTVQRVANMMGYNSGDYPNYVTATPAPGSSGYIAVEVFYCHQQVLGLPVFTIFVPNPILIHAYTIMPFPAAAPTPTHH